MNHTWKSTGHRTASMFAALWFLADTSAQVNVSISIPSVTPGEAAIASVLVDNAGGLAGADIAISVPAFISLSPAQKAPTTSDFLIASQSRPGSIEIAMAGPRGLADGQATILRIPLNIAKTAPAGVAAITFSRLQLYNAQPSSISAKPLNASISVQPLPVDLDNDGLPDSWEIKHFGDITGRAEIDSDRDGINNYQEFLAGTDPTASDSVFRILSCEQVNRAGLWMILIQWERRTGMNYEIEWSHGPISSTMAWHKVYNPDIQEDGSILTWTDDGTRTYSRPDPAPQRYYRIVVVNKTQ